MTDSVQIFPPGFRVTDNATGAPVDGAILYFYDAGTSTPKTVYADKDLLTALGTSVTCDSMGCPTSDGATATLIYTGTAAYKITIKDADGATIESYDNVRGALDTSGFGGSGSVTASFPVVTKSLAYTVLSADQNTLFAVNCSSADVTLTLPSAVTVGDGFAIQVQHAGTANQALLATVSSQTISEGSKSFGTSFSLALNGEELTLISDGGNWRVTGHTTPFIKVAQGIIPIIDKLSAPPGSPVQGGLYLLASSPSGDWSTFAEHDIAQYTGAGWINFTPYTDCGWMCWVADEDLYYLHRGTAWVSEYGTSSIPGSFKAPTQTVQETGSATDTAVTPATQQFHPLHPKVFARVNTSGGVPAIQQSYNLTSITDAGTGVLTLTIGTDFATTAWAGLLSVQEPAGNAYSVSWGSGTIATGSANAIMRNAAGTATDPDSWHFVGLGDQ